MFRSLRQNHKSFLKIPKYTCYIHREREREISVLHKTDISLPCALLNKKEKKTFQTEEKLRCTSLPSEMPGEHGEKGTVAFSR